MALNVGRVAPSGLRGHQKVWRQDVSSYNPTALRWRHTNRERRAVGCVPVEQRKFGVADAVSLSKPHAAKEWKRKSVP